MRSQRFFLAVLQAGAGVLAGILTATIFVPQVARGADYAETAASCSIDNDNAAEALVYVASNGTFYNASTTDSATLVCSPPTGGTLSPPTPDIPDIIDVVVTAYDGSSSEAVLFTMGTVSLTDDAIWSTCFTGGTIGVGTFTMHNGGPSSCDVGGARALLVSVVLPKFNAGEGASYLVGWHIL
jgi:hypothetical protein